MNASSSFDFCAASVASIVQLIEDLDSRNLAAVGIKLGRYLDTVPDAVIQRAEELNFPLLRLPDGVAFDEVLSEVFTALLDRQVGGVELLVLDLLAPLLEELGDRALRPADVHHVVEERLDRFRFGRFSTVFRELSPGTRTEWERALAGAQPDTL